MTGCTPSEWGLLLTPLHSEWPTLYGILTVLTAIGLKKEFGPRDKNENKADASPETVPTVKILKFGTPQTIVLIVLKIEKFDVTLH